MPNPVIRFDIGCSDHEAAQKFYADTFGWSFGENGPHSVNITSGAEGGAEGSITSLGHDPHQYVMIYIQVEDVREALDRIQNNGGTVQVGPIDLQNGETFAWIKDPDENLIAVCSG